MGYISYRVNGMGTHVFQMYVGNEITAVVLVFLRAESVCGLSGRNGWR